MNAFNANWNQTLSFGVSRCLMYELSQNRDLRVICTLFILTHLLPGTCSYLGMEHILEMAGDMVEDPVRNLHQLASTNCFCFIPESILSLSFPF